MNREYSGEPAMGKANTMGKPLRAAQVRCAIYTRKSHEDGLEQDFNSLDAQREACEAYILSQKSEGWICLQEMYDDGGISGATLERPALKRLMLDIAAGTVDAVVVYKVDRLTRSLGDFVKIVELFDDQKVSFVSVTQQFNTTTSMGRLTLNMLLSFAQFEREVTGERIRDKIAASKKKGLWMGGLPPLGYDVEDRKLVINETEAETVRYVYHRYLDLGSVRTLKHELDGAGIVSKRRTDRYGRASGGKPLVRGALYHMLRNRLYRGEIVHKETSYPGEHDAIVDEVLWESVQRKLTANRHDRVTGLTTNSPSLLASLIYDDAGTAMTPSHANKKGTRYRYYVSHNLVRGARSRASHGRRVPAGDLERLVEDRLCRFFGSESEVFAAIEEWCPDINDRVVLIERANALAHAWPALVVSDRRSKLLDLVDRIVLKPDALEIRIHRYRLKSILADDQLETSESQTDSDTGPTLTFTIPARLKRAGVETRLIIDGDDPAARRRSDHSLVRVLAQAHRYRKMALQSRGRSIAEMATEAGVGSSYFTRILRLSFLAPGIIKTILADRHPLELTANAITRDTHLPPEWDAQRSQLVIR